MARDASALYPPPVIAELRELNNILIEQTIYAVSQSLDELEVWPVDYGEPSEALHAAGEEERVAAVGLRIADRFVWLGTSEVEALIKVLQLSYKAANDRYR